MSAIIGVIGRATEAAVAGHWARAMLRTGHSISDVRVIARDSFDLTPREVDAAVMGVVLHDLDGDALDRVWAVVETAHAAALRKVAGGAR